MLFNSADITALLRHYRRYDTPPAPRPPTYLPLAWQVAPYRDTSPILLLTGSAGGGKSRVAAEKVHQFCLSYPGATWLILRKAREWCYRSILPFYFQTVVSGDPRVRWVKSEGAFYYDNGSIVYAGGMKDEMQRESIRSIGGAGGLDGAWLEEANAFTRQDMEEVSGRLRHAAAAYRQLILTTNPGGPRHWIYTDLIKQQQAKVYFSNAHDNTYNPADYFAALERMTGMMYKRLVLGQWVQSEGVVYDMFDAAIHVTTRPASDMQGWGIAVDVGYTNPSALLLIGIDEDDRWHVAQEVYSAGMLPSEIVKVVQAWRDEFDVLDIAVDAAAAGMIAELSDVGIPATGAKGKVFDGILSIQDRLKVQGDGRPRLTVDPSATNLIAEFESYMWKDGADVPLKKFDHALDAMRYFEDLRLTIAADAGFDALTTSVYGA